MQETLVQSLIQERSLGEGNGNPLQYSCLENPMEEEPGGLQSMGSQRAGYKQATEHERMHCRCINVLFWTKLRSYIQFLPKSIESFCCIFEKNHRQVFGVTQHAMLSAAGQRLGLIHQSATLFLFQRHRCQAKVFLISLVLTVVIYRIKAAAFNVSSELFPSRINLSFQA